jgi:hypothetical protein
MSTTAVQGIPDAPLPPAENQTSGPNLSGQSQGGSQGGIAPEPVAKSADREYVVLKRTDGQVKNILPTWDFIANIEATSAEQAVRRAVEKPGTSFLNSEGPTTLVAVPARSWNPVDVQVQTTTSIVLS